MMLWFSPCANAGSSGPPEDGSPPPVVVIVEGVISRAVASDTPPSPLPKSAVRPPCGLPLALALIAASVFSASLALYGQTIGARRAAGKVVVVERLHPEMDGAGIARE